MTNFPTERLREWFLQHRRPLPWRENPTPYRVWVSEIMLQQTQVAVVIPYFERWMELFPTIESLAQAPLEKVIKCWEGLGYYSRARNLIKGAQYLMTYHGGHFPNSKEQIAKIPGIGPYTMGAIRSFAFHEKEAAVDGNVIRVVSRFIGLEEAIDTSRSRQKLQFYVERLLPDQQPWIIVEGLIELGAVICMKKAKCGECPIQNGCVAFRHGIQDELPKKKQKVAITHLVRHVGIITFQDTFLIQKRESGKLMADLYEFSYFDHEKSADVVKTFEHQLGLQLTYRGQFTQVKQSFTRYRVSLIPHYLEAQQHDERYLWKKREELSQLPFSSGHKRILTHLFEATR